MNDSRSTGTDSSEKIQKVLARNGLGSRRELEKVISQGRIKVDGKVARLGDRVQSGQRIEMDNRVVDVDSDDQGARVIVYNKPVGEITTRQDPKGRRTVFDSLPKLRGQRWIAVGRLDINTSGLLLFTTDGELANRLMHPSANIDREYRCRIFGEVSDSAVENLRSGVELEDGPAQFSDIIADETGEGLNRWYTVCLMEGRNREVRRLWESQDLQVNRLKRVRYGPIFLPPYLPQGESLSLSMEDTRKLYRTAGLPVPQIHRPNRQEREAAIRSEKRMRASGKPRQR